MDAYVPETEFHRPGPVTRFLFWVAGADEETMSECPAHDASTIKAIAVLFLGVFVLQSTELSVIAHELLATDREVHPELIAGSVLIATLILLIDSYAFCRAGFPADGLKWLKRGGLDLTGGPAAKIGASLFTTLRLVLAFGFAQLAAIFLSLILFQRDISAEIDHSYQQQNAALIATTTSQFDADFTRAGDAVNAASLHTAALQKQMLAARDGMLNPTSSDAAVQAAQQEVAQLLTEKTRRDEELVAAEAHASNELAGIKGDAGNSGRAGPGPVRTAALERVKNATANADTAAQALAAARARLDELRKQVASTAGDRGHQAQSALPALEKEQEAAEAELATLRDHLSEMTRNRDEIIRRNVENAPDSVGRATGFLAQLRALRKLAEDPEMAAVILLIDLTSFGLEMAAIFAKVTCSVPTTYAALLARNAYMRVIEIVDEMDAPLRRKPSEPEGETARQEPTFPGSENKSQPPADRTVEEELPFSFTSAANGAGVGPMETKRPRGRPRKVVLN
jgi:Domain of unknown function (DUF4407)